MNSQIQRQEVGYVLLEECEVLVNSSDDFACASDDGDASGSNMSTGKWNDIELQSSCFVNKNEDDGTYNADSRNELILKPKVASNRQSWINSHEIAPFNGLVSEITNEQFTKKSDNKSSQRRSDASLLLGMGLEINHQADQFDREVSSHSSSAAGDAIRCHHLRHIRMERIQIMFWETPEQDSFDDALRSEVTTDESNSDSSETQHSTAERVKASLLVTFSLPNYTDTLSTTPSTNGINQSHTKKSKSKAKCKMISSALGLFASIVRCDWNCLDATKKHLQQRAVSRSMTDNDRRRDSYRSQLFPDVLTVEELYHRISGASHHFRQDASYSGSRDISTGVIQGTPTTTQFLDLPAEIIVTSITPYLRAKSLHALRSTNRKLNKSLCAVVPGLKLKLFQHQIRSLDWMEMRERKCVTEGDLLCRKNNATNTFLHEEALCGGNYHRAVTGGATVLLSPRSRADTADEHISLRFDAQSGCILAPVDSSLERKTRCARGGLLCDDPGLGKTITVLSLILRSIGLSTEVELDDVQEGDDESLFYLYWSSSFLTHHVRKPALLKLISNLIKSDAESVMFVPPIDPILDGCPDYFDVIEKPMCLQDIRNQYDKSDCKDFKKFEADVKLCFLNALKYNPPDHPIYQAAKRLMNKFQQLVNGFKVGHINDASKSMHRQRSATGVLEMSLVDAFEARKKRELQEPLVPSSSTLLVVPPDLLLHWQEQMMQHISFDYILKKQVGEVDVAPYIYYHTQKRNVILPDATVTRNINEILEPIIFIDDGSKELPLPSEMARFNIVLTSYNRFTAEWKNGSLEQEIRASKNGSSGVYWGDDEPEASPMLKVSWLRVIVDEGQVMGKNTNNLIQFAGWLNAERASALITWGMTGTPTQQTASQSGLRNLYFLTNYLQHGFFSRKLGREQRWNQLISSGWNTGSIGAFFRLKNLFSYLMVRHTKADLAVIASPVYIKTLIDLSPREVVTYNSIVSSTRANIITTTMEAKTSAWQDSLLNPRQSKHAMRALTNMRIACCGGTQVMPQIKTVHWNDTLVMCREKHGLDDVKVQIVNNFIYRSQCGELSGCHCCGIQLQTLFVIPCGHLVCTECISNKTIECPVCNEPFDPDTFQELQPGLDLQFLLNIEDEKEKRAQKQNFDRETSVVAPSRHENGAEVDEDTDQGVNPPVQQARLHKRGESCVYSPTSKDGKCLICKDEHFDCNFLAEEQCSICYKSAEECPAYASKANYVIQKLLQLKNDSGMRSYVSPAVARIYSSKSSRRPLKAIVFSEFREIYEYFGNRLVRRFGGTCVADFSYRGTRVQELHKFIHSSDCFVLLLSKQGSVGLDLSFVTHIFFLDSIFDKSLQTQVVARAYRMGATGPVHVEELVAKHSIEEVMNKLVAGEETKLDIEVSTDTNETRAKVHRLLKSAKLIRPHQEQRGEKRKQPGGNRTLRFQE